MQRSSPHDRLPLLKRGGVTDRLSPLTLSFEDSSLEAAFRAAQRPRLIMQARIALVVGIFLYLSFAWISAPGIQLQSSAQVSSIAWGIRLTSTACGLGILALTFRDPSWILMQVVISIGWLVGGGSLLALIVLAGDASYFASLILVAILMNGVSGLRCCCAAAICSVLFLGYELVGWAFWTSLPSFINNSMYVFSAMALTTSASYGSERYQRKQFAGEQRLSEAHRALAEAQSELVQSEKLASLGQLVAGVAHELNNPASFVHGGLENLAEYLQAFVGVLERYEAAAAVDPEVRASIEAVKAEAHLDYLVKETPELLRICAEGSERIRDIVRDLRVFVRADEGERRPTELVACLDSTLGLLGDKIKRAGVTISREYEAVPTIAANAGQLNQVWMNLLSNAIDATAGRSDGEVIVVLRVSEEDRQPPDELPPDGTVWVEVVIGDNGIGIEPKALSKIFDPFFTTKPVGRGTGLGLSIAFGAVKAHGGTIAADSPPGQGTTMMVRLPVSKTPR